jgi:hypothetical protein
MVEYPLWPVAHQIHRRLQRDLHDLLNSEANHIHRPDLQGIFREPTPPLALGFEGPVILSVSYATDETLYDAGTF